MHRYLVVLEIFVVLFLVRSGTSVADANTVTARNAGEPAATEIPAAAVKTDIGLKSPASAIGTVDAASDQ